MVNFVRDMLQSADPLVITQRQGRWLEENPNPVYSDEALEFAERVLASEVGGNRERTSNFRASALGSCARRQVYKAIDADGINNIDAKLANIFATGNFLHLKWQMQGLTEGWLLEAEIPAEAPYGFDFGGTLDGILYDYSLFEYKSINHRGYQGVCQYGPQKNHIKQAHGYMWLKELDAVSFVYEDKSDGEWREFRVRRDEDIITSMIIDLENMTTHVKENTLPRRLPPCRRKTGTDYRYCPYREICLDDLT